MGPQHWEHSLGHRTTREVPSLVEGVIVRPKPVTEVKPQVKFSLANLL